MTGKWRYPDKPGSEISPDALAKLTDGKRDFVTQLKIDGWRTVITFGSHAGSSGIGDTTYTSRKGEPIPVSPDYQRAFEARLHAAGVPAGSILDAEWTKRRPAARDECIWLLDAMQLGDQPLWREPIETRLQRLVGLVQNHISIKVAPFWWPGDVGSERVAVVHSASGVDIATPMDLFEFWREKDPPWCEGIVLKRMGSTYIGRSDRCADNPAWIKSKWRAGEDGTTPKWQKGTHNGR